jgi:uncharacterized protein (TIGR00375 family)
MIIRADLHIHSRYSLATSKNMIPEIITPQARLKGLQLVGSGDAFHKDWLQMIEDTTEESADGVYTVKENKVIQDDPTLESDNPQPAIVLTAEVEDARRVHHLLFIPSIDTARQFRKKLRGNLDSDGRPRVRMSGAQIQRLALEYDCLMGPSHAFTPWTSLYKEYNSINDCYSEKPDFLELGLSADSDMADRIAELQEIPFLTNSDAHSPWPHRLGREFNELEVKKISFPRLKDAILEKKITANYGFDPRLGKYHQTACIRCFQQFSPEEAVKMNMKCPCGGQIKKGVDYRVEELANWKEPHHPSHRPPYIHILPLAEIISLTYSKGVTTVFVQKIWRELIQKFGDEISVLIYAPMEELLEIDTQLARRIQAFRDKTLQIKIGGGGRYGEIIFEENSTLDSYL